MQDKVIFWDPVDCHFVLRLPNSDCQLQYFLNSGVKVSPQNVNLVYTGSLDQTIKLWDLRTGPSLKPVVTFAEEKTSRPGKEKPLTAFDVNCADRFIAAGTEQVPFDYFCLNHL